MQHEIVADFCGIDFVSVVAHNLHRALRRRTGVGDRSCSGQHLHVEPESHVLFACLIDAPDLVSLSLVRHQFGMFLDDQHKARQSVDVEQSAAAKVHFEDLCLWRVVTRQVYHSSTLFVLAVSFDIQHAVESSL